MLVRSEESKASEEIEDSQEETKGPAKVPIIILELAKGGDLFDIIALGKPLSESLTRRVASQLLEGLKYMHTNGVCHGDLKP